MFKFSNRSNNILSTVNRYLQLCAEETIKESAIDISIPDWGGLRSDSYQNELYNDEWSTKDGYINKSYHQLKDTEGKSLALDLCAFVNGEINWNTERLVYISTLYRSVWDRLKREGKIPKKLYLHSGMLWTNKKDEMGWDRPHQEIRNYPQKFSIKS